MSDLPAPLRLVLELSSEPAGSAFHTAQVSLSFGEEIDPAALRAAWEAVARAHPALRTAWDGDTPRELPEPAYAWQEQDWQSAPPEDLGAAWQALFDADGATPVTAEPHRFTILRLPNGGGHALWSFHTALLDEDSVSAALHRWLIAYDYARTGAELPVFEDAPLAAPPAPAEEIPAPAPLFLLPLPTGETPAGTRRSLSHTYERPERQTFAAAAEALGTDLRALVTAAWSFVVARAQDADSALLFEFTRPLGGIGRAEFPALRRRELAPHAAAADLIRASAEETPSLHAPRLDARAVVALLYRDLALNDRLLLELPRWMAADAQLFVKTAPPLALRFVANDRPTAALDYDPAILSDEAARALFAAFQATLAAFAATPELLLADFALPGTPALVVAAEAAPTFRSLVTQGIHEMFADAAAETPDTPAVEGTAESLTFTQLNALANQIARLLRKRGVNPGGRVALAMERSPQWVAALLGTLKAGAVIVLPGAETTADAWIVDELPEGETREQPVLQLRTEAASLAGEKSRGVTSETEPSSPALTWQAGGEWHTFDHATLASALQSLAALQGLTPADRVLQFAAPAEFAAIEETLAALLSGATLVLRPNAPWGTRTAFQEFIEEKAVTALAVPTAFWTQWTHYLAELSLSAPATLRLAITTGSLPAPNAAAAWTTVGGPDRWRHRFASAATGGLGLVAAPEGSLAPAMLGQPGPATLARVADHHGLPQPFGFPGHVEIAPASAPENFRALDLAAITSPDGTFFDLPAIRAGLGELPAEMSAAALRFAAVAHPQVFDAHAETRLIAARQEWCLWIIPRDSESGEPHDLRDWLTERLPTSPRRIRALPRFPLNDAGHLDLAALDELLPDDPVIARRKGSELEERVREALSRALGGRPVELDEVLTEGRTKPLVAQRFHEAVARVEPRVQLADFTTAFSVSSLLRNVRGRKTAADSQWNPIEPLRASGKQPPLIFVHDLDGTPAIYGSLVSRLGEDQPCYGISARGLADAGSAHPTVESMAAAYIEALRVFDASGVHRLIGYGFGGLVAFEMARQLTAAGSTVPLLVLLATEPPVGISASGLLAGGWRRALPAFLGGRKTAEPAAARRRGPGEHPVLHVNQEAARRYSAANVPLTAHIFAPEDQFPPARAIQAGWTACCTDARFYQVPCSGPEMMEDPAAEDLANILAKLARAEDVTPELDEE